MSWPCTFGAHALDVTNVIIKMDTVNNNAALLMLFQMVDTADRRRFAGAGRSAQYDAFTGFNLQVDVFQYMELPVPFIHVLKRDHQRVGRVCHRVSHVKPQIFCFSMSRYSQYLEKRFHTGRTSH